MQQGETAIERFACEYTSQAGFPPLAPVPAQQVDGCVAGQAVEPGGKARLPPEGGQAPPGGEERLLGGVPGVLRIAAHPQGQIVYLFLVERHQLGESVLVSPGGGPHQFVNHHRGPS